MSVPESDATPETSRRVSDARFPSSDGSVPEDAATPSVSAPQRSPHCTPCHCGAAAPVVGRRARIAGQPARLLVAPRRPPMASYRARSVAPSVLAAATPRDRRRAARPAVGAVRAARAVARRRARRRRRRCRWKRRASAGVVAAGRHVAFCACCDNLPGVPGSLSVTECVDDFLLWNVFNSERTRVERLERCVSSPTEGPCRPTRATSRTSSSAAWRRRSDDRAAADARQERRRARHTAHADPRLLPRHICESNNEVAQLSLQFAGGALKRAVTGRRGEVVVARRRRRGRRARRLAVRAPATQQQRFGALVRDHRKLASTRAHLRPWSRAGDRARRDLRRRDAWRRSRSSTRALFGKVARSPPRRR